MVNDFKAELLAQIGWRRTCDAVADDARLRYTRRLNLGTAAGEAEVVWYEQNVTLSAGAERLLDLTSLERWIFDGSMRIGLASVKALLVLNLSDTGTLIVGGAASDAWSAPLASGNGQIGLPAEGALLLTAPGGGWPVDAAHRHLLLAALGGPASYSIAVLGTLAAEG